MHGAFLEFKDGKMSKSSGKILTLSELEKENFSPLEYRYYTFLTHYRKRMIFSKEGLAAAKTAYQKLKRACQEIEDDKKINKKILKEFEEALNDDLDMPKAIQILWKLIKEDLEGKYETIKKMDEVFGLNLLEKEKIEIPKKIKIILEKRKLARKNKDWKKSDELRDKIKEEGFQVKDTPEGQVLEKL